MGRVIGIIVLILVLVAAPVAAGNLVQDFFQGLGQFVSAVSGGR